MFLTILARFKMCLLAVRNFCIVSDSMEESC